MSLIEKNRLRVAFFFFFYDFVDWTDDQSLLGYQCISDIKVQFGQTLQTFYSKIIPTHQENQNWLYGVQSNLKLTSSLKNMTGRMSFCLWTDVLLECNTSPRGWETDRSRPACDDSIKLRCIAFTGVMKSGHQREKPRKLVCFSHLKNLSACFL